MILGIVPLRIWILYLLVISSGVNYPILKCIGLLGKEELTPGPKGLNNLLPKIFNDQTELTNRGRSKYVVDASQVSYLYVSQWGWEI
jgi:hypothetical protein